MLCLSFSHKLFAIHVHEMFQLESDRERTKSKAEIIDNKLVVCLVSSTIVKEHWVARFLRVELHNTHQKFSEGIILQISPSGTFQTSHCLCLRCFLQKALVCQEGLACASSRNSFTSSLIHQCSFMSNVRCKSLSQHFYWWQAREPNSRQIIHILQLNVCTFL